MRVVFVALFDPHPDPLPEGEGGKMRTISRSDQELLAFKMGTRSLSSAAVKNTELRNLDFAGLAI